MTGTAVGVALALIGIVLIGIAFTGGRGGDATTSTTTRPAKRSASVVVDAERIGGTTVPVGSAGLGNGFAPSHGARKGLRGFGEVHATITDANGKVCKVCMLAATTEAQRERGLMAVTDPKLGGYDGMLFVFSAADSSGFWMRNTPMPLSIAYFDADGAFVSAENMAPCKDSSSCPTYPPKGSYRYAIEVPKGGLGAMGARSGAVVRIDGWTCPLAHSGS